MWSLSILRSSSIPPFFLTFSFSSHSHIHHPSNSMHSWLHRTTNAYHATPIDVHSFQDDKTGNICRQPLTNLQPNLGFQCSTFKYKHASSTKSSIGTPFPLLQASLSKSNSIISSHLTSFKGESPLCDPIGNNPHWCNSIPSALVLYCMGFGLWLTWSPPLLHPGSSIWHHSLPHPTVQFPWCPHLRQPPCHAPAPTSTLCSDSAPGKLWV